LSAVGNTSIYPLCLAKTFEDLVCYCLNYSAAAEFVPVPCAKADTRFRLSRTSMPITQPSVSKSSMMPGATSCQIDCDPDACGLFLSSLASPKLPRSMQANSLSSHRLLGV
jgi:hypothetical protein